MLQYINPSVEGAAAPCSIEECAGPCEEGGGIIGDSWDAGYFDKKGIIKKLREHNITIRPAAANEKNNYSIDINDYVGIREVGRGGMGTVLLAAHISSTGSSFNLVAIKVIKIKDGANRKGVHMEMEVLALVGNHPFLPRLHSQFASESFAFLVMDYCSGGDLNALRHRQADKRLSEAAIRFYAAELVLALEHLHGLGIVYRDLKPENVLISDTGHVVLSDFDLSLRLTLAQDVTCSRCAASFSSTQLSTSKAADGTHAETTAANVVQRPNRLLSCFTAGSIVAPEAEDIDSATSAGTELHCSNAMPQREAHIADFLRPEATRVATDLRVHRRKKNSAVPRARDRKVCTMARMPKWRRVKKSPSVDVDEQLPGKASAPNLEASAAARRRCHHFVGTEEYVAPEVIRGEGYSYAVDWWALGVLLYELMTGRTPFKGRDRKSTFYNIVKQEVAMPGAACDPLRDLLRRLLVKDSRQRLACVEDVKEHVFFRGIQWEHLQHIARPPFVPLSAASIISSSNLPEGGSLESFLNEPTTTSSSSSSSTSTFSKSHVQ